MANRTIKVAYDASDNIEYWGIETATGQYLVNRYYYDASDNLVKIIKERLADWNGDLPTNVVWD